MFKHNRTDEFRRENIKTWTGFGEQKTMAAPDVKGALAKAVRQEITADIQGKAGSRVEFRQTIIIGYRGKRAFWQKLAPKCVAVETQTQRNGRAQPLELVLERTAIRMKTGLTVGIARPALLQIEFFDPPVNIRAFDVTRRAEQGRIRGAGREIAVMIRKTGTTDKKKRDGRLCLWLMRPERGVAGQRQGLTVRAVGTKFGLKAGVRAEKMCLLPPRGTQSRENMPRIVHQPECQRYTAMAEQKKTFAKRIKPAHIHGKKKLGAKRFNGP